MCPAAVSALIQAQRASLTTSAVAEPSQGAQTDGSRALTRQDTPLYKEDSLIGAITLTLKLQLRARTVFAHQNEHCWQTNSADAYIELSWGTVWYRGASNPA